MDQHELVPYHYYMNLADTEQLAVVFEGMVQALQLRSVGLDDDMAHSIENLVAILRVTEEVIDTELAGLTTLGTELLEALYFETRNTAKLKEAFNYIVISFAYWICRQGGVLNDIDLIVEAIADNANETDDRIKLEALYEATAFIIAATSPLATTNDHDQGYNQRWQQLIFNYAIVATRSYTPELIESAYKTLIYYFPDQQQEFFSEAMSEMNRLNYPQHVRSVVERYNEAIK